MRVRHGRLDAAAAVADRTRQGARALRPDGERARVEDAGDGAAAGADGDHVDHRQADRPAADAAVGGEARLAAVDQADVGGGAADVDADQVGVSAAGADIGGADRARRRARQRRLDRRAAHGARAGDAAARLHQEQRRGDAGFGDAPIQALDIGRHDRHDRGIEDGRHAALVLAEHRQHLARQRDERAGNLLGEDGGDAPLVRRVGVAVQQHDGDRADALRRDRPRGGAHRRLVERLELAAVGADAAADLEDALGGNGALRLHPGEQAGAARHVLAADLQHVLEAGGGDERGRRALALQDQVGRNRGAVQDAGDVGARQPRDLAAPRRCRCRSRARGPPASRGSWRSTPGRSPDRAASRR